MNYTIKITVGFIKSGIFSSKREIELEQLPCVMEACFSENNVSDIKQVDNSFFCCTISSPNSIEEVTKCISDKIVSNFKEVNQHSTPTQKENDCFCLIGESSFLTVSKESGEEEKKSSLIFDENALNSLVGDIDNLIGWDSFKEFAHECADYADDMFKHKSQKSFRSQSYLFAINGGCGLTRGINLLTLLGVYIGAFSQKYYFEYILSDETEGSRICIKDLFGVIYEKNNYGSLICLDISEFLENSKQLTLKNLLIELSHYTNNFNFVFRVPYIEPHELKKVEDMLADILLIKTFTIPPFTDEQLEEKAKEILNDYDFKMDKSACEVFHTLIREEKSDGRFYGLRTVEKVTDKIILQKHKADIRKKVEKRDGIIHKQDIECLAQTLNEKVKDGFEELSEMIGMEKIIASVKEIVTQAKVAVENKKIEHPCMHMRFLGAPGTGKTTVARIIGKIFAENGLLTNGHFFEYEARDLCGQYVGQTAPRTAAICRDAYGSVLFIDEAYDLYRNDIGQNDYGKEALTTLIAEMENHRDNFIVIMAGYKKPMETLMEGNMGLRSRMPYVIEFPSYTKEQLAQIFMLMAKKHFDCDSDLDEAVKNYFDAMPQGYIDSEDFPNARYVRNLYERTWSKAAMRTQLQNVKEISLCAADFLAASSEKEFSYQQTNTRPRIGF